MNYITCSLDELTTHVLDSPAGVVSRMKHYYKNKGQSEIVNKIDKAVNCAKIVRLEQQLIQLKENNHDNEINTRNSR